MQKWHETLCFLSPNTFTPLSGLCNYIASKKTAELSWQNKWGTLWTCLRNAALQQACCNSWNGVNAAVTAGGKVLKETQLLPTVSITHPHSSSLGTCIHLAVNAEYPTYLCYHFIQTHTVIPSVGKAAVKGHGHFNSPFDSVASLWIHLWTYWHSHRIGLGNGLERTSDIP